MNEKILQIITHPLRVHVGVGVASFLAGGGLGYFLARRRFYSGYDDTHDVDISSGMNVPLDERQPLPLVRPPKVVIDEAVLQERPQVEHIVKEESLEVVGPEEPDTDPIPHNVFAQSTEDWDYEKEKESRSPAEPYIIHKDEFFADDTEYVQVSLTYFAGDDILVDQEDAPIYNHEKVVGPLKFGHGSGDPNVFYVRNDRNRAEYEVVRSDGYYSVEVLGLTIEDNARARDIKHSAVPKFRPE